MVNSQLEKKYSNLLLDPSFNKLELLYQKPNIFTALRLAHHEIRHSNFLGWLLNPSQTHGLGTKFLKLVIADILKDERAKDMSVTSIGRLNLDKAVVLREWQNIDILIKVDELVICIENKIYAGESKHQLKKYKDCIDKEFGKSNKVFVYLTRLGGESSMNEEYVTYSYERISTILQTIITTYREGISSSVMVYINDYVETLKTNFMKNGEINTLAREVYLNHKELFDFILNHSPNTLYELQNYFSNKLSSLGWIKKTSQKNYVRFLTKKLIDIIPNNSSTWKKEAFLFEFKIDTSGVDFYFTIAPGVEITRNILSDALKGFDVYNEIDPTQEYLCYSSIYKEFKDIESDSHNSQYLDNYLESFWVEVIKVVEKAEVAILQVEKEI